MGAWDSGPFDNDSALDWVGELEGGDADVARRAIEVIASAPEGDDLDADDCSEALAAAEVIAAGLGKPADDLPEEVTAWLADHAGAFSAKDAERAAIAVWRIGDESELQELWDEDGRDAEWHGRVDALYGRLRAVAGAASG